MWNVCLNEMNVISVRGVIQGCKMEWIEDREEEQVGMLDGNRYYWIVEMCCIMGNHVTQYERK